MERLPQKKKQMLHFSLRDAMKCQYIIQKRELYKTFNIDSCKSYVMLKVKENDEFLH